jgi:potassium efflux system protein
MMVLMAKTYFTRILLLVALLLFGLVPGLRADEPSPETVLTAARQELQRIEAALKGDVNEARLVEMRDAAMAIQARAVAALDQLQPRLAAVDARVEQLGPTQEGTPEAEEVKRQRADLDRQRRAIDADVKGARLLVVEAGQLADAIAVTRRTQFNARLWERTSSVLSPNLWRELASGLPRDLSRIEYLGREGADQFFAGMLGTNALVPALSVLVAVLVVVPGRRWLRRLGRREAVETAPASRLRRSGFAVWSVAVGTITLGLAAQSIYLGLDWAEALSPRWDALASSLVLAAFFGSFVAALGRALLAPDHASWRLAPITDAVACCLQSFPSILALVATCGFMLERLNAVAATGLSAALVTNCVIALGYSLAGASLLIAGRTSPCAEAAEGEEQDPASSSVWRLIRVVIWLAIILPILSLLFGYIALAGFIARQTLWMGVVGITLFLLLQFADDLCTALFDRKSRFGRFIWNNFGLGRGAVEQLGVVLSAAIRLLLLFVGLGAILAPFGTGPAALFDDLGRAASGVTIGELTVSPAAMASAIFVFALGVVIARIVRRWLNEKYLPKTDLDPGVRNSVSTVASYLGIILASLWALSSLGIGVERLALVASALSVGIGFGLQAIVQNFISGLILLAERPVKVGDWVSLGEHEGDIRKIKVRATEIQLGDRSTLVVPNSELITKIIRNVTLSNPLGRVQIQIGVGHEADPEAVRKILLDAFAAHEAIKDDPAPAVFLDAVKDTGLHFNAVAFVGSPRLSYGVRSELLFDLLARFRLAGIEIARPRQDVRLVSDGPTGQEHDESRIAGHPLQ